MNQAYTSPILVHVLVVSKRKKVKTIVFSECFSYYQLQIFSVLFVIRGAISSISFVTHFRSKINCFLFKKSCKQLKEKTMYGCTWFLALVDSLGIEPKSARFPKTASTLPSSILGFFPLPGTKPPAGSSLSNLG